MMLFDVDKDPYETNNVAYDPEYAEVVIAENSACNEFLAKFHKIEPIVFTAKMLKGKKKEQLVAPS
jgi:hypothetical protein